jgi:hypothetical protein
MSNTKGFRGTYTDGGSIFDANVVVLFWEESGVHYAYSPALDMTGYGKSEQDAKHSFEITMKEFVEYTHHKKTLFKELQRLGWTVNVKKKRAKHPSDAELLADNETYRELKERPNVRVSEMAVAL